MRASLPPRLAARSGGPSSGLPTGRRELRIERPPSEYGERASRGVRHAGLDAADDALVKARRCRRLLLGQVQLATAVDDLHDQVETVAELVEGSPAGRVGSRPASRRRITASARVAPQLDVQPPDACELAGIGRDHGESVGDAGGREPQVVRSYQGAGMFLAGADPLQAVRLQVVAPPQVVATSTLVTLPCWADGCYRRRQ